MTPQMFDAATPQERNEAIAPALDWTRIAETKDGYFEWLGPNERIPSYQLPDWQGDDGLAFKELWPEILKLNPLSVIGLSGGGKVVDCSHIISARIIRDGRFTAETWAHAICKAFLKLRGEGPTTDAPLASEGAASKEEGKE